MDYRKQFLVAPGTRVKLAQIDPSYTGAHTARKKAEEEIRRHVARLDDLQYLLYADASQSLLIVLQALDAGGKDGAIRHIFSGMNAQGTSVAAFKEPSRAELAHDFLWRAHLPAPAKGEVVIYNRSYYENVLVVRVHQLVPKSVWSTYYQSIKDFEKLLEANGTRILKFYLHISPEEQLDRFKRRLDDKARQWKISESDYSERKLWPDYVAAYEDVFERTSTPRAPWYIVPANHKWFRNLAISQIIADTMEEMGLKTSPARVDLAEIRKRYHAAYRATHRRKRSSS